ncbi:MAG TPA: ankyrin repeat domain-containing protein [Candidatus Binatia bacterium]|nr:ankyrin repeat domain-containing protein [Candidatus Binatia bacterium]
MSAALFRVCLPGGDLESTTRFYSYLLQDDGERPAPGVHQYRLGTTLLAFHDATAEEPVGPSAAPLYLAMEEPLDLLQQRVRTLNPDHVGEIQRMAGGETGFFVVDPAGNRIALVDGVMQQAPRLREDATAGAILSMLSLQKDFLNEVKGGNLSRVRELVLMDSDLPALRDAAGISAIMHAAYKHQPHVALFLAERAGAIDFWEACALGQTERVAAWLDANPEAANQPSPDGFLPLGLACYFGHYPCVDLLLNRGADVNAASQNARQLYPLHSACGHREGPIAHKIAHRLVLAGADVHAVQQGGYSALHQAADRGDAALVALLLQSGARADAPADNGRTPLSLAAAWGHGAVIELLQSASESLAAA